MEFKRGQLVTTKKGEFPGNIEHGQMGIVASDRYFEGTSVIDVYWLHSKSTYAYLPNALMRINPQAADNEV